MWIPEIRRTVTRWAAVLGAVLASGCITDGRLPDDVDLAPSATSAEQSAPLGGEALTQHKLELRRAYKDVIHFNATLESLDRRRDRSGQTLFRSFLDAYLGMHLEPLLSGEWQSRHPELTALDANLRFAKAELLIRMREQRRAQRVIEEIERRYAERDDMVVGYPLGQEGTLREGLEVLRDRKWWRG